nr:ANTAR domain-containing protein [Candidatus Omnitrophota bacterium]
AATVTERAFYSLEAPVIREELEMRKTVERAKGILMRQQNMTEEEAFRMIQKQSMDMRKSMREIAEAIILIDKMKK